MTWRYSIAILCSGLAPAIAAEGGCSMLPDPMPESRSTATPAWQTFEHRFLPKERIDNPFLAPVWVIIDARIPSTGHEIVAVPAFYDGDEGWKIRYTPLRVGVYSVEGYRIGKELDSAITLAATPASPSTFTIMETPRRVFPTPCAERVQRFRFNTGEPYFPIGHNAGWASVDHYERMFQRMAAAGLNWSRVWMTHWSGQNLDWIIGGELEPGTLDLGTARRWDAIIAHAEANGILLQLVLQHHGQYSTWVNPNWAENPWNVRNGGWLDAAPDFFTDEKARRLTKAKYRYIVARWGHSPAIIAWELFNEVEFTDGYMGEELVSLWQSPGAGGLLDPGAMLSLAALLASLKDLEPGGGPSNSERLFHAWTRTALRRPPLYDYGLGRKEVADWHIEMAEYLRRIDNTPRMITTSSVPPDSTIWSMMDFLQIHSYERNMIGPMMELPRGLDFYSKPVFIAEIGDHGIACPDKADGRYMHGMMWAGLFSGASGAAQVWAWDRVAELDLYKTFESMTGFTRLAGIGERPYAPVEAAEVAGATPGLNVRTLAAPDALIIWLYDKDAINDPGPRTQTGTITLRNHIAEDEPHRVTWWDTRSGRAIESRDLPPGEKDSLTSPPFAGDIAAFVQSTRRNQTWSSP